MCLAQCMCLNVSLADELPAKRKRRVPNRDRITATKKTTPRKKKWKPMATADLSFELSLLPRRAEWPLTDCDIIYDMDEELKKFEKELEKLKDSESQTVADGGATCEDAKAKFKENILAERVEFKEIVSIATKDSFDDLCSDYDHNNVAAYEDKVPYHVLDRLGRVKHNRVCKHLRSKHKWKYQKARKAIKTKYYTTMNILNNYHGRKLFVNHRFRGCNNYYTFAGNFLPTPRGLRLKDIDKKGFVIEERQGGRKVRQYAGGYAAAGGARNYAAPARNYPVAQPVPAYALRANNADGAFENDLVNILINMQNRDLTPEDYDLLLRLDERVAPKTLNENILESFKTDIVTENELNTECAICMEAYQIGQERKHLPCGHIFHKNCIDTWLKNSSLNCPLDGLSVEQN